MPNVTGRGIYGFNTEMVGRPATAIYAVKPGQTTYSPSTWVYTWCDGAWVLAFGQTVQPPASVSITYGPGTKVNVTWTVPAINVTDTWTVKRFNGTVVASGIPAGTLTVTDNDPILGTGTYTVEAVMGGVVSSATVSNSLTIDLQAASASAVSASTSTATITWTDNAAQGAPDEWRVYNASTGVWASGLLPGSTHSVVVSGDAGTVQQFAVYPYLGGQQGAGRNASTTVAFPALAPTSVSVEWVGTRYSIRLHWAYPGGTVSNYEIEGNDTAVGSWVALGTDGSGLFDWGGMSGQGSMRVRSLSAGGPSDWTTAGPVTDTTGPVTPAVTATLSDFGRTFLLSYPAWNDAQSGNGGSTHIQVSYDGGGWTTVLNVWSPPPDAGAGSPPWSYTVPIGNRGQRASFRLLTWDQWDNMGIGPATTAELTRPVGNISVLASGVDYYTDGVGWRQGWVVYSDNAGSRGVWFYGTGLTDATNGFVPESAYIYLVKEGSNPAEAGNHNLQLVQNADFYNSAGAAPILVGGVLAGPNWANNNDNAQWAIPHSFYQPMVVGSVRGVALVDSGGPRRLYGTNLNPASGMITFVYNF